MTYKEGTYLAVVTEAGVGKIGEKQTPAAVVQFNYQEGDQLRNIRGTFYLTPKAVENSIEKLFNAGFRGKSFTQLQDPAFWTGQQCEIVIKNKEGNDGKLYAEVAFVNIPGASKFAYVPREVVQSELAGLDGELMSFAVKNGIKLGAKEQDFSLED